MPQGYVLGVGKTRFGPTSKSLPSLAQEAILAALKDAGLEIGDIDAFIVANYLGGPNEGRLHLNAVVAGLMPGLNLPGWRVEAACASGGVAVHQALLALSRYERVLVVGVERMSGIPGMQLTRNIGMAGDLDLDQSAGLNFPASYALVAQRHMQAYGTTTRDLELISLKNHDNARLNPLAHFYHKTVTQADIDAGAMVASPLRLFDCCPVSDGAAAAVLSAEPRDRRSVPVLGSALSTDAISLSQRSTHTSFAAARTAASNAYRQAGVTARDVDFAEVHDCFTIAEVVAMEDLALCDPGEATRLIREGVTARDGELPINASGGLKAGGHAIGATGVGQVYEVVQQLRGEAGGRQLGKARIGLTHNVGGVGGTCAVHIMGRPDES
ncbi:MAG: thiolase domain-containing protein [Actinomycetia bacterium]|nr:thiolase domain-containing protein [Actinomycetes bacterium]